MMAATAAALDIPPCPAVLGRIVREVHADEPDFNRIGAQEGCPALPDWRDGQGTWAQVSQASRAALLAQSDLVTQLTHFVASSG